MGRGRSSSGGGGRGFSSSGGRGRSSSSWSRGGHSHTTVIIGGGRRYYSSGGSSSGRGGLIFMGIVFLLFGVAMLFASIAGFNSSSKYAKVQAEAIENTYMNGWYYTTYEYTIDSIDYVNRSNEGWEFPEVEGRVVTIYYLKNNPNEITEKAPASKSTGFIILGAGLLFGGIGVALLVWAVKSKKEVNNEPPLATENVNEIKEGSNDVTCPYCGSKYNRNLSSCPKCGAGRK